MRTPTFSVEVGWPAEYRRAKVLLNRGRHPTFIGRDMVANCATNGGLLFFVIDGVDAAVALVRPSGSVLLVLNVSPSYRGGGLGDAILNYIKPNFVRSIRGATRWFTQRGYTVVGEPKQGRSFITDLLVRTNLIGLAGRLRQNFKFDTHELADTIGVATEHLPPALDRKAAEVYERHCDDTRTSKRRPRPNGKTHHVPGARVTGRQPSDRVELIATQDRVDIAGLEPHAK